MTLQGGGSRFFDGTVHLATADGTPPVLDGPVSMFAWVNFQGTGSAYVGGVGFTSSGSLIALRTDSGGNPVFEFGGTRTTNVVIGPDIWYGHGGRTYGSVGENFVNGRPAGTGVADSITETPARIRIGTRPRSGPSASWTGFIAHFAMWNDYLSDHEMFRLGALRESPLLVRPRNLVWYRSLEKDDLNDAGGSTGLGLSPTKNRLTINTGVVGGSPPPYITRPPLRSRRIAILSAGVSVGITDGEIAAAATSFDNRPFKPDTIFVPSS